MELTSVNLLRRALLRLVGTESTDPELGLRGEDDDEVIYVLLTRGVHAAQRYMLKVGYGGWRRLSGALSFTEDADGRRSAASPDDFLRAAGSQRISALVETDGKRWGQETTQQLGPYLEGDFYYFIGDVLWLSRRAQPPSTLYLDHHYKHPVIAADLADEDIDFPLEARPLIPAEGAFIGMDENWLPGGDELRAKIVSARNTARENAQDVARPTKQARQFRKAHRIGNRW